MQGQLTSAATVDGTFELRGVLVDSGAYHEQFRIVDGRTFGDLATGEVRVRHTGSLR